VHHTLLGYLPRPDAEEAVEQHGGRGGLEHPDDEAGGLWDVHGVGFWIPPPRDDGQPRSAFIGGFVPGVRATVAPPGDKQPVLLLRVPQWDYNWQSAYYLREPKRFPAGTRFEAWCSFDNSAGNPRNPFDPPQNVWHNATIHDEMRLPVLSFVSDRMLDGKSESFLSFWASTRRASFLKRLVEDRYKYVFDPDGTVRLAEETAADKPSEFICVLGPSGVGKSTLVRALLGEREITAGRLLVGFSTMRFPNHLMLTRMLDPGEKEVLADVWGEVREAISKESVAQEDASIPGQIRVFLDGP
jgi:hypothetical protein